MNNDVVSNKKNELEDFSWLGNISPIIKGKPYTWIKRIIDVFVSVISLPVWLPIMLLCTLLVKLDSPQDPVFFSHNRTGKNGKRFKLYKFRTMVKNAEELKSELNQFNELEWPDFKITNDPRITKIGNLLRKTSLDELPQIFNILMGEMSLVGPRPTSISSSKYTLWQTERLDTVPGLTGIWQLFGRGEAQFYEKVRMDILYIHYCSLGLDLYLLLRTPGAVLKQKGAK